MVLDHRQSAERAWERLLSAHKYGDCLITVATSQMEEDEAEALGLVPTHAYAVLDIREVGGTRLLLVKNPWAHKRWTGKYSLSRDECHSTPCRLNHASLSSFIHPSLHVTGSYSASDMAHWTPELRAAVKYDPSAALRTDDGVFWIDWASIRRSVYHQIIIIHPLAHVLGSLILTRNVLLPQCLALSFFCLDWWLTDTSIPSS